MPINPISLSDKHGVVRQARREAAKFLGETPGAPHFEHTYGGARIRVVRDQAARDGLRVLVYDVKDTAASDPVWDSAKAA